MEKKDLPRELMTSKLWDKGMNPISLFSTLTLHRNLSRFFFPPKLTDSDGVRLFQTLHTALSYLRRLQNPQTFAGEELSPFSKEFLFEHFLCESSFQNSLGGEGLCVDRTGSFLALLNIDDHLQLHLLDRQGEWTKSLSLLSEIEQELSTELEFAYDVRFGFLTSNPSLCGTGLVASVFLHLPALTQAGHLKEMVEKEVPEEVEVMSLRGKLEELVGDIVVLRNRYTLGLSEEAILQPLQASAVKFMSLETGERSRLKQEAPPQVMDKVARAYGLLLHSYQLHAKEALDALSLVMLGREFGWIEGITLDALFSLFFLMQHAHLASHLKLTEMSHEALSHKRAEYLHSQLKGMELKTG